MSSIPYPLEPLARCNPYFEVVVKPGILDPSLTFAIFTSLYITGGYCKVVDWGDGTSSETTKRGAITHTYSQAGTYTVRIKGKMTGIRLGYTNPEIVYDTNANWDALGKLTESAAMFSGCRNA